MKLARLILGYRVRKIQRRYAHLGYETKPRRLAVAYAGLIKPEWVSKVYTPQTGSGITIQCRFNNAALLVESLNRVLQTVESREYIQDRDKITGSFSKTLDSWLLTVQQHDVNPVVLTQELVRILPRLSASIDECQLARKEMVDYYERFTLAIMEDATMFLGTLLGLYINK